MRVMAHEGRVMGKRGMVMVDGGKIMGHGVFFCAAALSALASAAFAACDEK